jgi:hypothetical protein
MTKFEKGHLAEDGKKWQKPADFIPPDAAMRAEIEKQNCNLSVTI